MEFKRFSAGSISYGKSNPTPDMEKMKALDITNVCFEDHNV
jgi:hypothetical protein